MSFKTLASMLACLALLACGFKAQVKSANLTGRTLVLAGNLADQSFIHELRNQISLAHGHLSNHALEQAPTRLILSDLVSDKRLLVSGNYGQGQVYLLSACLRVAIDNQPSQKLCSQRRMSENYNQQLSNLSETSRLQAAIFIELISLILIKLGMYYGQS